MMSSLQGPWLASMAAHDFEFQSFSPAPTNSADDDSQEDTNQQAVGVIGPKFDGGDLLRFAQAGFNFVGVQRYKGPL